MPMFESFRVSEKSELNTIWLTVIFTQLFPTVPAFLKAFNLRKRDFGEEVGMDGNAFTFIDHKTSNRNEIFLQYPFYSTNETETSFPPMKHRFHFSTIIVLKFVFHQTRFMILIVKVLQFFNLFLRFPDGFLMLLDQLFMRLNLSL